MLIAELAGEQPSHRPQISCELLAVPRGIVMITTDHPGQEEPTPVSLAAGHTLPPDPASAAAIAAPVSCAVRNGLMALARTPLSTRQDSMRGPNCGRRSLTSAATSPAS